MMKHKKELCEFNDSILHSDTLDQNKNDFEKSLAYFFNATGLDFKIVNGPYLREVLNTWSKMRYLFILTYIRILHYYSMDLYKLKHRTDIDHYMPSHRKVARIIKHLEKDKKDKELIMKGKEFWLQLNRYCDSKLPQ